MNFGNQVFTYDTPNHRLEFPVTAPPGINTASSLQYITADIHFTNFFAQNPAAHAILFARCRVATLHREVHGHGIVWGNLRGTQGGTDTVPGVQMETRTPGISAPVRWLMPGTGGPLQRDNTMYRISLWSHRHTHGLASLRYKIETPNHDDSGYDCVCDRGDYIDNSWALDYAEQGIAFGAVGIVPGDWSIELNNLECSWLPADHTPGVDLRPMYERQDALERRMQALEARP